MNRCPTPVDCDDYGMCLGYCTDMRPAFPMRGFFADMTPEQKKRALEYMGEENHGDPEFVRKP